MADASAYLTLTAYSLTLILFLSEHYGADLDDETGDNDQRSHDETAAIEHGGVEDIRVVAAATAEEDVTNTEQDDADGEEDVVHGAKGEVLWLRFALAADIGSRLRGSIFLFVIQGYKGLKN